MTAVTYRLFLETTKACIKNFLPESYQTKEAVIEPVIKNNSVVLQGFSMRDGKAGRAEPVLDQARRCNLGRLCPEHFREVVEDFLAAW